MHKTSLAFGLAISLSYGMHSAPSFAVTCNEWVDAQTNATVAAIALQTVDKEAFALLNYVAKKHSGDVVIMPHTEEFARTYGRAIGSACSKFPDNTLFVTCVLAAIAMREEMGAVMERDGTTPDKLVDETGLLIAAEGD